MSLRFRLLRWLLCGCRFQLVYDHEAVGLGAVIPYKMVIIVRNKGLDVYFDDATVRTNGRYEIVEFNGG